MNYHIIKIQAAITRDSKIIYKKYSPFIQKSEMFHYVYSIGSDVEPQICPNTEIRFLNRRIEKNLLQPPITALLLLFSSCNHACSIVHSYCRLKLNQPPHPFLVFPIKLVNHTPCCRFSAPLLYPKNKQLNNCFGVWSLQQMLPTDRKNCLPQLHVSICHDGNIYFGISIAIRKLRISHKTI